MTFHDVVGIKVKHLNMFATLSSFLRAFGLIVMLNDCAVPIESSEIKAMVISWCMGPQSWLWWNDLLLRNFPILKVAIDGIIFENSYFPAIKQCSPFLNTLSTDPIFSGSVFPSSKTSIFAQKIDASMAMFEATFSSSD